MEAFVLLPNVFFEPNSSQYGYFKTDETSAANAVCSARNANYAY